MVHHLSGIPDYTELMEKDSEEDAFTPADVFSVLAQKRLQLLFKPGSQDDYSNSNYFLLARVVERVSGTPTFAEFAKREIFRPLGMRNTYVIRNRALRDPRLARAYEPEYAPADEALMTRTGQPQLLKRKGFRFAEVHSTVSGDEGVVTTLADLARWDANLNDNRLGGGSEWLQLMLTAGTKLDGTQTDYGFGIGIDRRRGLLVHFHMGESAGFLSSIDRYPDSRISAAMLCNRNDLEPDPQDMERKILETFDRLNLDSGE